MSDRQGMVRRVPDFEQWTWYAVMTPPQREVAVSKILSAPRAGGFATFVPQRKEWRSVGRNTRRKRQVTYPLMPRYVFVGMSDRTGGWMEVFNHCQWREYDPASQLMVRSVQPRTWKRPVIQGVVGVAGRPIPIRAKDLRSLFARGEQGDFTAPDSHAYMQTYREFAVGETAEIIDGALSGCLATVVDIHAPMAKVIYNLFGAEREIEIALEKLAAPTY